jgi:hypothetical protein
MRDIRGDGVRDPNDIQDDAYDVSETAFKKLYQDLEDERFEETMNRSAEAQTRIAFNPRSVLDLASKPVSQTPNKENRLPLQDRTSGLRRSAAVGLPPAALEARPSDRLASPPDRAASARQRRRPIRLLSLFVVAAIAVALIFIYVPLKGPTHTPSKARAVRQSPVVTGILHVADLAAGHTINPGETYGVETPPSEVNIAIATGQVALTKKDGVAMRACSNESFTLSGGGAGSESPLIAACGGAPAFIQAVIPQPALPADPASPPVIPKSGD